VNSRSPLSGLSPVTAYHIWVGPRIQEFNFLPPFLQTSLHETLLRGLLENGGRKLNS
jgi:hypothetical protein